MKELVIRDLHVRVENKEILKGVNLTIHAKETIALLGPNGHGKSTLLAVLMGHPKYEVTQGSIVLDGQDLLALRVDERAKKGLFLAMQYPSEVPGVVNSDFLKTAMNVRREQPIKLYEFYRELEKASTKMNIPMDMATRFLNEGFSGGEKKRNEILQMLLLKPQFAMLDEIDSGLDVDALHIVGKAIDEVQQTTDTAFLVVSHYARLYELVRPTKVAIMINGKIECIGDPSYIDRIDKEGYEWMKKELGIEIKKVVETPVSIGTCAVKQTIKKD